MPTGPDALPRTTAVLAEGMREGLHLGAQLYVSRAGTPVADVALGLARPDVAMTPETLMLWFSSTKALVAVAVAQCWERGLLELDDPVARHIPEFAARGKERVTIRHVLTHTAGFRWADHFGKVDGPFAVSWEESLRRICEAPLEPGWVPGETAGYHPTSGMFVLGEIVRRRDGRPFDRYVREAICEPLGMRDTWVGMPPARYRAYGSRIGLMHNTATGTPRPLKRLDSEEVAARCVPGANGRGPIRELGFLYEMLCGRGARAGVRLLSPQAVEALSARHRTGMLDQSFGIVIDWGLGFIIDAVIYGRHASRRTFGHGGAQSSVGFCDPEHALVVACVTNGMPGRARHYPRFEAIASAIYEDLGLAAPGSAGRRRAMPTTELA
jgi:CubicO group peptidase (beta-lactamase class C family)